MSSVSTLQVCGYTDVDVRAHTTSIRLSFNQGWAGGGRMRWGGGEGGGELGGRDGRCTPTSYVRTTVTVD
jgi:hypothetical protein